MKYRSWKVLALAVCAMTAAAVEAKSISGAIAFGYGTVTVPGGMLNSAGGISGYQGALGPGTQPLVLAGSQTGDYSAVPNGTSVLWSPFSFGDTSFTLWSLEAGGTTFSFKATSISIVQQNDTFLDLKGNGIASITGYDQTPGTWTITINSDGTQFTFGATTSVPAPDGGNTVWFLGACMLGLILGHKTLMLKSKTCLTIHR